MSAMPALIYSVAKAVGMGILLDSQATVRNALGLGVSCPDRAASVGIQDWTKIPAINAMGHPTAAYTWFFMNDDACARRGNRGMVEVKWAMQLCPD